MAEADVAKRVDDAFAREDAIGGDELVERLGQSRRCRVSVLAGAARQRLDVLVVLPALLDARCAERLPHAARRLFCGHRLHLAPVASAHSCFSAFSSSCSDATNASSTDVPTMAAPCILINAARWLPSAFARPSPSSRVLTWPTVLEGRHAVGEDRAMHADRAESASS